MLSLRLGLVPITDIDDNCRRQICARVFSCPIQRDAAAFAEGCEVHLQTSVFATIIDISSQARDYIKY
jgi:hypothetical protein